MIGTINKSSQYAQTIKVSSKTAERIEARKRRVRLRCSEISIRKVAG